ncbi:MAG TPA: OmpA family protein [Labilithrix sp.]|nr:OmpA family protein [Labilithrix sp.]
MSVRKVRRLAITSASFAIAAVASRPAFAQLDAERFKPSITHDGFLNADGSAVRPTADRWELGAFLHYGRNQLVTEDANGDVRQRLLSGRLGGDLFASATIAGPFAIGLGVPFYVLQTGDANPSFAGLGDVRLVPKLRILDDRTHGIGLGIAAEVRAPSHLGDFSGGTRMPVVAPRLIIDHRFRSSGWRIGANAGAVIRERTTYFNIVAASELAYAVAAEYRFGGRAGKTALGLELLGGVGLVQANKEELPHELFGFFKHSPSHEIELVGGVGGGMVGGFGVPVARVFFGLIYRPTSHDSDHDGVPDDQDKCRNEPEDQDGIEDTDGCPEDDSDSDGIPDAEDRCPTAKETINGFEDDDGCPDEGPAKVIVEEGQIRILETVRFKTNSSELEPESHSILNQVALTMKANKHIKRVRVEGHTDETGSRDLNKQLSEQRANVVRQYLVKKGVKGDRLSHRGYGPDRPLVKGNDEAAHAKNRRVEFIVEQ